MAVTDNSPSYTVSNLTVDPRTLADATLRPKTIAVALNITSLTGGSNSDLEVRLESPNGTQLALFSGVNIGGAGFQIVLADNAATAISSSTPAAGKLTGTFRIEGGALLREGFGSFPVAGTWRLLIRDLAANDTYELTGWGLKFTF